ncbi:MAG: hypothetical protein DRO40_13680, partial [Thermoprotei archaeon]
VLGFIEMIDQVNNVLDIIRSYLVNRFSLGTRLWLFSLLLKYHLLKTASPLIIYTAWNSKISGYERQEKLIWSKNFDALILLDACRYDVFSIVVYEYLDGRLKPVVSPASYTTSWLRHVWSNKIWNDIVYVSATLFVNKRGLFKEFDARDKFLHMEEVWDWGWSKDLAMVPPSKVNLAVKIAMTKMKIRGFRYRRDYRLVVHYIQPHVPYIVFKNTFALIHQYKKMGYKELSKFTLSHLLLGLLKETIIDNNEVSKVLRRAYEHNLRWVLKYVAELASYLDGRIVITSDHGELLGEYGLYFHPDVPLPQLRLVPWFVVR